MSTVPTFVLEESLPTIRDVPLLKHAPKYPHNYGVAIHLFEVMIRADAITDQAYGPHTGNRLVLTQAGPMWRPAKLCKHCGEAIWQDGTEPGRGIWMHMQRDPVVGFRGRCEDAHTRAEPAEAPTARPTQELQLVDQDGAR